MNRKLQDTTKKLAKINTLPEKLRGSRLSDFQENCHGCTNHVLKIEKTNGFVGPAICLNTTSGRERD